MQPSIARLKASDGTGNASVATVTTLRNSGATTILVDTVENIPATFFGTMGTPHTFDDPISGETITVISEESAVDFAGSVDGSNLEIDEIADGYTDNGSAVDDIIIIRPTTQYANSNAEILEVAHNDDGSIKDDAINDADQFTDDLSPVVRAVDNIFDHVASGCVLTGTGYGSTLGWNLTAGVVYINGKRLTYAGGTGSVTATKDTYFDLLDNGDGTAVLVNTAGNIVTVNAASPALAANSVRIGIIQSGATIASVAAVNQGQEFKLLPIASSVPYQVTDSLGNLICPRDPNRRVLAYRQITATQGGITGLTDITGLSIVPFRVPYGRKIKVTPSIHYTGGVSGGQVATILKEGATTLQNYYTANTNTANVLGFPVSPTTLTTSEGLHTYKMMAHATGGGTMGIVGTGGVSALLVELV